MTNELQEAIKKYHGMKMPIFPVKVVDEGNGKASKKPLISNWQKIMVEDFDKLDWSEANAIGMPTGRYNTALVLDLDLGSDLGKRELPITVSQRTGSGGCHYFYKPIKDARNRNALEYKVDIRGVGGFVVIPPSWHPKGKYEWLIEPREVELAEAPKWLKEKLQVRKKHDVSLAYGAAEGSRNESAASVIGYILSRIDPKYWADFGLEGLRAWNKRNTPPLSDDELVKVFKSIAARQYAQRQ